MQLAASARFFYTFCFVLKSQNLHFWPNSSEVLSDVFRLVSLSNMSHLHRPWQHWRDLTTRDRLPCQEVAWGRGRVCVWGPLYPSPLSETAQMQTMALKTRKQNESLIKPDLRGMIPFWFNVIWKIPFDCVNNYLLIQYHLSQCDLVIRCYMNDSFLIQSNSFLLRCITSTC